MPNEQFLNKHINILKASLPFLPRNAQRFISYYIKIEEFNILCSNLDDEIDNDIRACANDNSPNPNDLVNAIKPFLNSNERELVDMFLNMTRAINMYNAYKSLPNLFNDKVNQDVNINEENYETETYNNKNNNNNSFNGSNFANINNNNENNFSNSDNSSNVNNSNGNNSNVNSGNEINFNNVNIDMLKNMLSPSQRAMFDTYSSMLNK